ncbi:GDSL esterase/lipase At5g03610-like [Impatiens glandulifera]|uniref:GDSL esterase/lipase At5g03610-like n=1 Tax=Impatiens glandulifera TaxID=253017 RepID=UPI001FB05FEC|nr:GDSL esterase/lipase At5g03610-like [Impatiens glandulifera]
MAKSKFISYLSIFFFILLAANYEGANGHNHHYRHRFHPKKLFVFGDSYVDTGNTNKSLSISWKVPYGITFPNKPAGRFSDGRVLTDFLARFYGLKSPLPYMLRNLAGKKAFRYGTNFAFGGTGVFNTVFPGANMTVQTGFLKTLLDGSHYSQRDLDTSMALVALSGNDYSTYLFRGGLFQNIPAFITQVVNQLAINLKSIHDMGVKKVVVTSLQPLGCLPRSTILNSFSQCNATENTAVEFHNLLLRQAVAKLNNETANTNRGSPAFIILDLFSSFNTTIFHDDKFVNPLKPCCMGIKNGSCGVVNSSGVKMYTLCKKPENSFFWDTVHPTQAGWRAVYLTLRSSLSQI